jgi:hypothetical protein
MAAKRLRLLYSPPHSVDAETTGVRVEQIGHELGQPPWRVRRLFRSFDVARIWVGEEMARRRGEPDTTVEMLSIAAWPSVWDLVVGDIEEFAVPPGPRA